MEIQCHGDAAMLLKQVKVVKQEKNVTPQNYTVTIARLLMSILFPTYFFIFKDFPIWVVKSSVIGLFLHAVCTVML